MFRTFAFVVACLSLLLGSACANEAVTYQRPVLIRVEGFIGQWFEHYLVRKIEKAKSQGCDLLILEIDSPGGEVTTTLDLCDKLTSLGGVHTVAYVPKEALSGASLVALACDDIVLAPNARIGDCGVIEWINGSGFEHASEKIRSNLIAQARSLAMEQNHSPVLVEAMIDMNVKVDRYKLPDGTERLLTDREVANTPDVANWQKIETLPESGGGRFLTLLGNRAKELGLAKGVAASREDLYKLFNLNEPPRITRPTFTDKTVFVLNHWAITALLLIVGVVALGYELSAPGIGVGGLTAALCFMLFFWARFLGGTSGWLEVLLFAAGVVFLAVELFVIPGFGITGVMGIVLMLTSLVLASQEFTIPRTTTEMMTTLTSIITAILSSIAGFAILAFTFRHMESLPVLNRLMLKPPVDSGITLDDDESPKLDKILMTPTPRIGDYGRAITLLRPGGKAEFDGHTFDVVSTGRFLQPGIGVQIVEIQGSRIVVDVV